MVYTPDGWTLVKITGTDPHYRVFGSWRGGYLNGDSWRMNSGITSVTEEDNYYVFKGSSGSEYYCHKEGYGRLGSYGMGVLSHYAENSQGTLSNIEEMPDVMNMEWNIS